MSNYNNRNRRVSVSGRSTVGNNTKRNELIKIYVLIGVAVLLLAVIIFLVVNLAPILFGDLSPRETLPPPTPTEALSTPQNTAETPTILSMSLSRTVLEPLNGDLAIDFVLNMVCNVDIAVLNEQGLEVHRILNWRECASGPQNFYWDGCGNNNVPFAPGRYTIRVSAGIGNFIYSQMDSELELTLAQNYPTPSPSPTLTPTPTPTPAATATRTPAPTNTPVPTSTPTPTPTNTPVLTSTPTATPTATSTDTPPPTTSEETTVSPDPDPSGTIIEDGT